MNEQRPSKELFTDLSLLRASGFDDAADTIDRLVTALRGIQSCSTCEACRGAATLALGHTCDPYDIATTCDQCERDAEQPVPEPAFACIGNCGASVSGPNAYCSACFLKARAEQRATSEPAAVQFWDTIVGPNVIDSDSDELRITMSFCRREDFDRAIAHIGAPPPPGDGQQ